MSRGSWVRAPVRTLYAARRLLHCCFPPRLLYRVLRLNHAVIIARGAISAAALLGLPSHLSRSTYHARAAAARSRPQQADSRKTPSRLAVHPIPSTRPIPVPSISRLHPRPWRSPAGPTQWDSLMWTPSSAGRPRLARACPGESRRPPFRPVHACGCNRDAIPRSPRPLRSLGMRVYYPARVSDVTLVTRAR